MKDASATLLVVLLIIGVGFALGRATSEIVPSFSDTKLVGVGLSGVYGEGLPRNEQHYIWVKTEAGQDRLRVTPEQYDRALSWLGARVLVQHSGGAVQYIWRLHEESP